MGICFCKCSKAGSSSSSRELNKDTLTTPIQSARYASGSRELATGKNTATSVTTEHEKYYMSASEELSIELQAEDPMLPEQTYYGSAPEHLWSELQVEQDAETVSDENLDNVLQIDPSELELVEEIAQGAQAHVYLARWGGREVVVKRYKGRGVDALQLRGRLAKVMELPFNSSFWICNLYGYSEDSTTGEVSVVMQAMRGDLRNLIDLRVRYLKSRMRNTTKKGAQMVMMMMMMPFPQHMTLFMMRTIVIGVQSLHSRGLLHKDLKASNIFVSPYDSKQGFITRNVKLRRDLAYAFLGVAVGDYKSSNGVVGTGFWRAPEVLKALRNNITPTYSAAVDVYGFGMVCYELLTGLIPFEGHRLSDYELVLSGGRPELPNYLSLGITQLLHKCWHMLPTAWLE